VEGDVAADPAGAAGLCRQWRAFDDGTGREGEVRDEQQVFHAPGRQIIMHEIKVRCVVAANGGQPQRIPAYIRDEVAEYFGNKGTRSWNTADRRVMPEAWRAVSI
jgi:hypothetical protein